jgi:hypothetical protein
MEEDVSRMLEGGQLSGAAKEALSELFHVEPDAAAQVERHPRERRFCSAN